MRACVGAMCEGVTLRVDLRSAGLPLIWQVRWAVAHLAEEMPAALRREYEQHAVGR